MGLAAQLAPLEPETIRARLASMNIAVSPEDEKRWRGEFILIRVYGQLDMTSCFVYLLQTRAATVCGDCGWWRGSARRTANPSTIHPGIEPRTVRSANVTPRVWTMADPANATAPIPADAIDRMVRCLGAFQLFLFPYVWAISILTSCFVYHYLIITEELGSEVTKGTKAHRRWPKAHRPDRAGVIDSAGTSASLVYPPRGRDRGVNWNGTGGSGTSARCVFISICPLMSSSYNCLPVW